MIYEAPTMRDLEEILNILAREDTPPNVRTSAVLSAVFYVPSEEFVAEILISEFSKAKYREKIDLKNLFETFHQMRGTSYRIDESIQLMREYEQSSPENADEIRATTDALIEFRTMFANS